MSPVVRWDGALIASTPRLLLRSFRRRDLAYYAALNADPRVYEHLGGFPLSREHSDGIAEWAQQCYEADRFGLLAVERRDDGAFLGMCGLHHQESYPDDVEIGWRFASQFWGSGYATEAAQGWLEYGFSTLGLPRIISMTDPENERSIAVMKRLGLTYDHEAEITDDEIVFHAVIYTITASQWANDNGRAHMEESPS